MKRREFIGTSLVAGLGSLSFKKAPFSSDNRKFVLKNNINHSVCRWCFNQYSLEEFLPFLKSIGVNAIDLIGPSEWPILQKYDIYCSMCNGAEINLTDGWCDTTYHEQLIKNYTELIPKVAENGYKNLICFSGNRRGISDYQGLENCVQGLSQIIPLAEQHGVVIQMELFNQKNHPDCMGDHTDWGVELCRRLGSESFKLLYDIYHMQIQEGDIIATIRDYHQYFGHYHTAGVPGRNEIDDSQELNYPAIMNAIKELGITDYVAQEFIPTSDNPLEALKQALKICDV